VIEDVEEGPDPPGVFGAPGGQAGRLHPALHPVEHVAHQADDDHRGQEGEDEAQALVPGEVAYGVADPLGAGQERQLRWLHPRRLTRLACPTGNLSAGPAGPMAKYWRRALGNLAGVWCRPPRGVRDL